MRASSHGRGANSNPPNRFERIVIERDGDWDPSEDPATTTQFFKDSSETFITYNDSPDTYPSPPSMDHSFGNSSPGPRHPTTG